ncbi:MAG: CehA/McbA family metallohydrolase, partial [Pirellulaceae bacterium]
AEDLDFAPVIGWWNSPAPNAVAAEQTDFRFGDNRIYCTGAGEDERAGGALLYCGLKRPLDLSVQSREFPSPMHFVRQAHEQNPNVWIDVEKPFWWDVPTWLAVAKPDSIGIAHNHMHRGGVLDNEAWGNPRDREQFPGVQGNGLWTQEIYYHILNCGMRIPPSAGSASGVLPNPVGYNRVYVQLGNIAFTRDNWFAALKSGRCFVTNGPLLRVTANQAFAGETFYLDSNSKIQLEIKLASNDPVSELEVIYNGKVTQKVPCSDATNQRLSATVDASEPGWLLVRAIADVEHTFRFASTAPWYLQDKHQGIRVSRKSVDFLIDWIDRRIADVQANVDDVGQRESILKWHLQARDFYSELGRHTNAD